MLSRLWYLILATALGLALAAAFLMQSVARRNSDATTSQLLGRDFNETALVLQNDALQRLGALEGLSRHEEVRIALASQNVDDTLTRKSLESILRAINRQLKEGAADVLAVVNTKGKNVASIGLGKNAKLNSLGKSKAIRTALRGKQGIGHWWANGRIFRVVARPVMNGSRPLGAVVHAMEVDDDLVGRLAKRMPGVSMAFFRGKQTLAAFQPPGGLTAKDLSKAIAEKETNQAKDGQVIALSDNLYCIVQELKTSSDVALHRVIGRKRTSQSIGLADTPTRDDVVHLPWFVIAGFSLIALFIGLGLLSWEWTQPAKRLLQASQSLAEAKTDGLPALELKGIFRRTAQYVNEALKTYQGYNAATFGSGNTQITDVFANQPTGIAPDDLPDLSANPVQDFEEDSTQVRDIPEDLLAQIAESTSGASEQSHFRDVFRDFVNTRRRCNEPVEGLTFEKFCEKLRRTQAHLMTNSGVSNVHFSVYVKNGRAALKATPKN